MDDAKCALEQRLNIDLPSSFITTHAIRAARPGSHLGRANTPQAA